MVSVASRILLFHEIEVGGFAAALADFGLDVEVGPLPTDTATDAAIATVVLVRPRQLGRYREVVRDRALFVTAGRAPADVPVTPDVVHFVNVSRSRPVTRRVVVYALEFLQNPGDELNRLIDEQVALLTASPDDERQLVLPELTFVPQQLRQPVRERLYRELTHTYAPEYAHLTERRAVASFIRGWMISAIGTLGGADSEKMLTRYCLSQNEPDDLTRYWLVANLYWMRAHSLSDVVSFITKSDPSDRCSPLPSLPGNLVSIAPD
jgi:hypothetical protein